MAAAKTKRKKLEDFRSVHDKSLIIPAKIEAAFKKIGPYCWLYEAEFMAEAGISQTDFSRFRAPFEAHMVETRGKNPKRVWCGSKALAAKLRSYTE